MAPEPDLVPNLVDQVVLRDALARHVEVECVLLGRGPPPLALPFLGFGTGMNDSEGRRPPRTSPVGPWEPRTKCCAGGSYGPFRIGLSIASPGIHVGSSRGRTAGIDDNSTATWPAGFAHPTDRRTGSDGRRTGSGSAPTLPRLDNSRSAFRGDRSRCAVSSIDAYSSALMSTTSPCGEVTVATVASSRTARMSSDSVRRAAPDVTVTMYLS